MANINELAKQTLLLLKERGLKATPENYTEIFEELSLKRGMSGGTKEKINKFKALLIPSYQEDKQLQNVKNVDEFLSYLISKLNRQSKDRGLEFLKLLISISKSLLASKDKKVREMANLNLSKLSQSMDNENIFLLEKKWQEWEQEYRQNTEIESKLNEYGIKNEDYTATINKLLEQLNARSYRRFAALLCLCLHPSLTQSEAIKDFELRLRNKPYTLAPNEGTSDNFLNELSQMVSKRINADMMFVQKNLSFFEQNLQKLSQMLDALNNTNESNVGFVNNLKKEKDGKVSLSFDELKEKFDALSQKIEKMDKQVHSMNDDKEREEWSLQTHIAKLDENFLQNKSNYTLCVFSVSNYRFIIERYGLENLKEILMHFKRILKDNCSRLDELWILDEKSYLLVIYEKDYNQIIEFMQRNISEIESFKFIYKQEVVLPKIVSFFMDKQSYPHLNLLEELSKKINDEF